MKKILRRAKFLYIFQAWAALWVIHFIIELVNDNYLRPRIDDYSASILQLVIIIPCFFSIARIYVNLCQSFNYRSYPWIVGIIWVLSSLFLDVLTWNYVFHYEDGFTLDQFKIWEYNFYTIQLLCLLSAPPIMRKYRNRFKRDPFVNLITKGKFFN